MNLLTCDSPHSSSHSTFDSSFQLRSPDSYQGASVRFVDLNSTTDLPLPLPRPRYRLSFLNSETSVASTSTSATPSTLTNLRDILLSPFHCISGSRKRKRIRSLTSDSSSGSPTSDRSTPLPSPLSGGPTGNDRFNFETRSRLWVNPILFHKPFSSPSLDWDISMHPLHSRIQSQWWMDVQRPNDFVLFGCHTVFIVLHQRLPRTASPVVWNILIAKRPIPSSSSASSSSSPSSPTSREREHTMTGFRLADIIFAIYDHFNTPLSKSDLSLYTWTQINEMRKIQKERLLPQVGLSSSSNYNSNVNLKRVVRLRPDRPPLKRVDALQSFTAFAGLECVDVDNGCCIFELRLRKRLKPWHLDRGGTFHK